MRKLLNNKRGDFTGLIFLVVTVSAFAIFLLIIGYIAPLISESMVSQIGINEEINHSLSVTTAVAEKTLPVLWLIMFGGLFLSLIATSLLIRTHPVFTPIYAFLLVVAVMVAVPLSNAYEELTNNVLLADTSALQSVILFLMINLPLTTLVIGLLALIITFAKPGDDGVALA